MKRLSLFLALLLISTSAFAVTIPAKDITQTQYEKLLIVIDSVYPSPQTCDENGENCTNDNTDLQQFWIMVARWVNNAYNRSDKNTYNSAYTPPEDSVM